MVIPEAKLSPGGGKNNYRAAVRQVEGSGPLAITTAASQGELGWVLASHKAFSHLVRLVCSTTKKTALPPFYRGENGQEEIGLAS